MGLLFRSNKLYAQTDQNCVNILNSGPFKSNHASVKTVQACCKLNLKDFTEAFIKSCVWRQMTIVQAFCKYHKNSQEFLKFSFFVCLSSYFTSIKLNASLLYTNVQGKLI